MPSIREIIDFARQTGIADADFISTFDPEHQSKIEDIFDVVRGSLHSTLTDGEVLDVLIDMVQKLDTYRKERGLDA